MQYDDVLNEEFFPRIGVSSEEAFKLKETIENSNTMDGYNILGMSLRNNKEYILANGFGYGKDNITFRVMIFDLNDNYEMRFKIENEKSHEVTYNVEVFLKNERNR